MCKRIVVFVVFVGALIVFSVACHVADQHGVASDPAAGGGPDQAPPANGVMAKTTKEPWKKLNSKSASQESAMDSGGRGDNKDLKNRSNEELFQMLNSGAGAVDPRMEELKYSQFCTEAAERFWQRYDWKTQQNLRVTSYTSHYNKNLNRCFVDVHGVRPLKGKVYESDHVFDALENTVLGGGVVLREGGVDGEIETIL
jgi:hypothetical protein